MATREELGKRMAELPLSDADQIKMLGVGTTEATVDQLFDSLVGNPQLEQKVCHQLNLWTEAEKVANATLDAAKYAKLAFGAGVASVIVSVIAVLK